MSVLGAEVTFVDEATFETWAKGTFPAGFGPAAFNSRALPGLGDEAFQVTGIHFARVIVAAGRYRAFFDVFAGWTELLSPELDLAKVVVARLSNNMPQKGYF